MPMTNFEFSDRIRGGKRVELPEFPDLPDKPYSDNPSRSDKKELLKLLLSRPIQSKREVN